MKNVLMLSVDDMTAFVTLKSLYPGEISTPNIDRLMSMGTTFTEAFSQTALCNPSRTSLLTGQLPPTTQVLRNDQAWYEFVDPSDTIFSVLRSAGYHVASAGKLFHGLPGEISSTLFDERAVFTSESTEEDDLDDGFRIDPFTGDPTTLHDVKVADWSSDFLASYDSDKPFFLSLGFHRPHGPWDQTPIEYHELYDADQLPLPHHLDGDLSDVPASALFRTVYHERVLADDAWQPILASYFAAISFVDDMIGRVLDALETSSFADDTMIVFFSDHGYHLGDKDIWHKFTLWDSAARAPLIVVDPASSTPGSTVDTSVGLVDLFPTILDLLGLPQYAGVEGVSLKPLIEDPDLPWDGAVYTFMYGSWSVRTDEWRYTRYHDGAEELYDVEIDPYEHTNLAPNPNYQDIKAELLDRSLSYLAGNHWFQTADESITVMRGTSANDNFVPAAENATLIGGSGDDVYFVWDKSQRVVETASGGSDLVITYSDFTQPLNVERVIAVDKGDRAFNLQGNIQDNWIHGSPRADFIFGLKGNDFLDGAAGSDELDGSVGNDTLFGGDGNDLLEGGGGNDSMNGDLGADTLFGGNGIDALDGGDGNDSINGGPAADILDGNLGNDIVEGGTGSDRLSGNDGDDKLLGGDGSDTLIGGQGSDVLTGHGGNDHFVFDAALDAATNVDVITDFTTRYDRIHLDDSIFATLSLGALTKAAFYIGGAAHGVSDRIIYNSVTGALLYDPDGTGPAAAIPFAQLSPGLALTQQHFLVV